MRREIKKMHVITGETFFIKDDIKGMGGIWEPQLRRWIFETEKEAEEFKKKYPHRKVILIDEDEARKTIKELEEKMKGWVAHYHKAARDIYTQGYYRKYRIDWTADLYIIDPQGKITQICDGTTRHRTWQVIKAYEDGTLWDIEEDILENYVHNGYMTRRGLFRSSKNLQRIKRIADSHRKIYWGGKDAHDYRVFLRNK